MDIRKRIHAEKKNRFFVRIEASRLHTVPKNDPRLPTRSRPVGSVQSKSHPTDDSKFEENLPRYRGTDLVRALIALGKAVKKKRDTVLGRGASKKGKGDSRGTDGVVDLTSERSA